MDNDPIDELVKLKEKERVLVGKVGGDKVRVRKKYYGRDDWHVKITVSSGVEGVSDYTSANEFGKEENADEFLNAMKEKYDLEEQ